MAVLDLRSARRIKVGDKGIASIFSGGSKLWPPPEYATVALGIAGVADGGVFIVPQSTGYHFRYTRVGSAARFDGWMAATADADAAERAIVAETRAFADAPTDIVRFSVLQAKRWGRRLVPNANAAVDPTLAVVDPFSTRDEDGGTTPAVTPFPAVTDPLGGQRATRLDYAAVSSVHVAVQRTDHTSFTNPLTATMAVRVRSDSSTQIIGLGASNRAAGSYAELMLSSSWQTLAASAAAFSFSSVFNLGILPALAATVPFTADTFGLQIYLDSGPVVLPSLQQELDGWLAGHAKSALARPDAIPLGSDGMIRPDASSFVNIYQPRPRSSPQSWTMGGWVDFTKDDYPVSYALLVAFVNQGDVSGGTTELGRGALGLDTTVDRYGRIYSQPSYSTNASRCPVSLIDQGPVHLSVTVERVSGDDVIVTPRLFGIPLYSIAATAPAFPSEGIVWGAFNASTKRRQGGGILAPDGFAPEIFAERALTDQEIVDLVLARLNYYRAGRKFLFNIAGVDSLASFSPAPTWDLGDDPNLRDVFQYLDATGGTFAGDTGVNYFSTSAQSFYAVGGRKGMRERVLSAATQVADLVTLFLHPSTNDIGGSARWLSPTANPYGGWQAGAEEIFRRANAEIDALPTSAQRNKVRLCANTIMPRNDFLSTSEEANRLAYNTWLRNSANQAANGIDHVVDVDAYVPQDYASMMAAVTETVLGPTNPYGSDRIHFSDSGGAEVAANVWRPFFQARLASIQPIVVLSSSTIAENAASGTTVGTLSVVSGYGAYTFSITSDPENKFIVSGSSLVTEAGLDYETDTSHPVTIQATNGVDTPLTRTFTIVVTDIDDTAPTITSSAAVSNAENATLAHSLTANEAVTWAIIGGADQSQFELSGSTLRWSSNGTRNFEAAADADANNTYLVQVRATDGSGNQATQTITVTVTDVDEIAPTITSSASVSVAENATLAHSLTANETVTWSIVGGADQAQFELSGSTLRWSSNGTRDFEAPADADSNNAYIVQVRATDTAGNVTNQTITVTVTDVAEGSNAIEWSASNTLEWGSGNDMTWGA